MTILNSEGCATSTELIITTTVEGIELVGALWTPICKRPGTGILLASGNGGHFFDTLFIRLGRKLAQSGYLVLSMDRRDAGEDFGYHNMEPSAMDHKYAIDQLEKRDCDNIILAGHSYGTVTVPYYVKATGDRRVKALLLYAPLGDMRSASVVICGGRDRYDKYTAEAREAVACGRGKEAFLIPPMVAGGRPMVNTHEVFLNKRGPESQCNLIEIIKHVTGRPILGIRDPGDPFPATLPPTQEKLLAANGDLEYVLLPDLYNGRSSANRHYFNNREEEIAKITVEWLMQKGFLT